MIAPAKPTFEIIPGRPNYFPDAPPPVITPEMDVRIEREAARMERCRYLTHCWCADALEANPEEALQNARAYIRRFVEKETPSQRFFQKWDVILREKSVPKICALLRGKDTENEQLRLCAPVFEVMPDEVREAIYLEVYGE